MFRKKVAKFFGKVLNVAPTEMPHVTISWMMGLIARISVVIGWTLLTVFFVSNYGIASLPYLFILHAFGIILGSFLFGQLVDKLKQEYLLIAIILFTSIVLAISASLNLPEPVFIGSLILSLSVLNSQFRIVSSLFTEDLFTPTQSSRVFPIIESSQTLGLIIGGAIISVFAPILPLSKFLYVWMIIFLLGIPALMYYLNNSIGIPFLELIHYHREQNNDEGGSRLKNVLTGIKSGMKIKFIKSLVLIVLLQWMFFNILEFQYTKAIEQSVTESHESLVLHDLNEFGKTSVLIADEAATAEEPKEGVVGQEIVEEETTKAGYYEDFEGDFAKDLAMLQVLFGVATLVFQLLLASRFLSYLGVVGSMLIYPIVLLLSMIWMTINFSFGSAILARFNHEVGHVMHGNAYHSSYYALAHSMRGNVKEFLEGFIRPIGAIFGTLLLILLSKFFAAESLTLAINVLAIVILLIMLVVNIRMRPHYDDLPKSDLETSKSLNVLINALNIIEQNATHHDASFLIKVHTDREDLPITVEKRLIRTIGSIGSPKDISYLLDLTESREDLRLETLHAINDLFTQYSNEIKSKPFTWYSLRKIYQDFLRNVNDPELKAELISFIILSNYHRGLVDEIMDILDSNLDEETISVCADTLLKIDDEHVVSFLRHLVDHKNASVKAAMLYVLSQYLCDRSEVLSHINDMISSKDKSQISEGLILIYKLKLWDLYEPYYINLAVQNSEDTKIMFLIKASCFNLGYRSELNDFLYTDVIYDDLFELSKLAEKLKDPDILSIVRRRIYSEIHELYVEYSQTVSNGSQRLNHDQLKLLVKLQGLYKLVDAQKEYYLVEEILR